MSFEDQLLHSNPLFFKNNTLKFGNKITLENILFVNKSINRQVPPISAMYPGHLGDQHTGLVTQILTPK